MEEILHTCHEWYWDPTYGFFGSLASFVLYLDTWTPDLFVLKPSWLLIDGGCKLYYFNFFGLFSLRLPLIFLLSIIGLSIGFYGFYKIYSLKSKLTYSRREILDHISLFDLQVSFFFFGCMNFSGIWYHSILPITSTTSNDVGTIDTRQFFHLFDQVSTGISGIFLGTGFYYLFWYSNKDITSNKTQKRFNQLLNKKNSTMISKYCVILGILLLGIIVLLLNNKRGTFFTDLIYLIGLGIGIYYFITIYYFKLTRKSNKILSQCVKQIIISIVILAIGFLFQTFLCQVVSFGYWSVGETMFVLSDVCFYIVFIHVNKYLKTLIINEKHE